MGCQLVILACNTASAKALRTIQQIDLPKIDPRKRVLGIIRPTVEYLGDITRTRHVGILATSGTIKSQSYPLEIKKLFPDITVSGEACPIWVPLVECGEAKSDGADYFVRRHIDNLLAKDDKIDTLILGCTHYPILYDKIRRYTPSHIKVITQGEYVGKSLVNYMERHPEMDRMCTKQGTCRFLTTESGDIFKQYASIFFDEDIQVQSIALK
jgi:glutamate racemase